MTGEEIQAAVDRCFSTAQKHGEAGHLSEVYYLKLARRYQKLLKAHRKLGAS